MYSKVIQFIYIYVVAVFQSLSHIPFFVTPWTAAWQATGCLASLSITVSLNFLKLISIESWVSDAIQPFHPLLSPCLLPSIFPSIRVFSKESALRIRWPKYWSLSSSISPSSSRLAREKFLATGDIDRVSPIISVSSRDWNGGRCKTPFRVTTVQRKTLPPFALLVLEAGGLFKRLFQVS